MGLLDMFGENADDPKSQAVMSIAAGLIQGTPQGLSQGLLGSSQAFAQAKQNALRERYTNAQIGSMEGQENQRLAEAAKLKQQMELAQAKQRILPALFGSDGKFDVQSAVRAGFDPEEIAKYANLKNAGLDKVARTVEGVGPGNTPVTQQFDDYGRPVGESIAQWKAPVMQDFGGYKAQVDPVTGQVRPVGANTASPEALMTDARAREANGAKALETQKAQEGAAATYDTALASLGRLQSHPGLSRSVGIYSKAPTMPGSESANFQAELDTFKAQAFLPMVQSLKGMGALSDAEGKKLGDAVGALNTNMSEKAFKESVQRIYADLDRARVRAGGSRAAASGSSAPANVSSGSTINSKEQYDALPPGTVYTAPDGKQRVKR